MEPQDAKTAKTDRALWQNCAKSLIELALDASGHDHVYEELCGREPQCKSTTKEAFLAEYVPSKLALGCVYWVRCCANHKVAEKELKNLYFKEVMSLFESPQSLESATRFSEALYASNAVQDHSPVLGVLIHLFQKLTLDASLKTSEGEADGVTPGFCFMMEVSEALKVLFEKKFEDFYYTHADLCGNFGRKCSDGTKDSSL